VRSSKDTAVNFAAARDLCLSVSEVGETKVGATKRLYVVRIKVRTAHLGSIGSSGSLCTISLNGYQVFRIQTGLRCVSKPISG
jgi:hypothetical protein